MDDVKRIVEFYLAAFHETEVAPLAARLAELTKPNEGVPDAPV